MNFPYNDDYKQTKSISRPNHILLIIKFLNKTYIYIIIDISIINLFYIIKSEQYYLYLFIVDKALSQTDWSYLLSFSNRMALAEDEQHLARVIDEVLRESMLVNGFVIVIPDGYQFVYENTFTGVERQAWIGFIQRFIRIEHALNLKVTVPENKRGITTAIGTGLTLQDKNTGMLWLFYDRERSLTKNRQKLLQEIIQQITVTLSQKLSNATAVDLLVTQKIGRQLNEINQYRQQLEEKKLYLQQEASDVYAFSEIIGSGPEMTHVYEQMAQVACANSTVLILGETGTGKELIARAIHRASRRKDKLMVKVNCASIPENLIESELFGHEKGSFTGAIERRIGKFELANNGTLFLDEVGEMPIELQVKLLRAIQEREIERIGGKSVIKADVRIIAATNRDLLKEVQDGNFRSDLYYRLNVFPINLPPLRERKDDIPALVAHFIERFVRNTGRKVSRVAGSAMKDLLAYDWPGNVRELEHLLERSILMSETEVIHQVHLPNVSKKNIIHQPATEDTYVKTSLENERDHILFVLRKCHGKIYGKGGAAELLDMHVSTLNSRIKKLGIRKEAIFTVNQPDHN